MDKKMTEAQNEVYQQLIKKLDIIVLAQPTIKLLKTDDTFRSITAECIGIVNYFETTFDIANGNLARYNLAYHTICGEQVKFDDNPQNYKNIVDLKDKVHFLDTFLLNKINMNFDDLENSFKTTNQSVDKSEDAPKTTKHEKKPEPIDEEPVNNKGFTNHPMSDEEILERNHYTTKDVADQIVNSQAALLLQRNAAKGKVFIYKSKPKIVPVIKIITFILFLIIMAMSLASYIVLMLPQTTLEYTYTSSSTTQTTNLKFTNPFPYVLIITLLFIGLMAFSVIRNMKNDNAKFFMPWGWLSFFIFFLLIINMSSNESQILFFNRLGNFETIFKTGGNIDSSGAWTTDALKAIQMIEVWKIFQYVIYACIVLIVVCIISAVIFNPKKDVERMQELLRQYAMEIRNGEIDTSEFSGSPFGGIGSRMF